MVDSTGKITGYTTNTGGADTVFPFSSEDTVGKQAIVDAMHEKGLVEADINMTLEELAVLLAEERITYDSGSYSTGMFPARTTQSKKISFKKKFLSIPTISANGVCTTNPDVKPTVTTSDITLYGFTISVFNTCYGGEDSFNVTWSASC